MSLLTSSQMAAIRKYGELGMTEAVTITKKTSSYAADDDNPFGDGELEYETHTTTVKGWIINVMHRELDEEAGRIVAIHDVTLRLPVGTDVETRDLVTVRGEQYTVMEVNIEDTWPEWTSCYIKRVA